MILQKEIRDLATQWGVLPEIVDKDNVLGHFLSGINATFGNTIVFKGGTCLRKCYIPEYRFSEDLDFSARESDIILDEERLNDICQKVGQHSGIQFVPEEIKRMIHNDVKKGYQVKIKYWGAYHDRNQPPPSHQRWNTKIKVEISTEELILLTTELKKINHPYSDALMDNDPIACYPLDEIIAEKIRSLVQRSYTAPRDYYDLYYLTESFTDGDWKRIKPIFVQKMAHKNLTYTGPDQLADRDGIEHVRKAWNKSLAYQINDQHITCDDVIREVVNRIQKHL